MTSSPDILVYTLAGDIEYIAGTLTFGDLGGVFSAPTTDS